MSVTLPLDKMTMAEKIGTMESLWDDLVRGGETMESPLWHGELLDRRDEAVRDGTEPVLDWAEAKKRIRESVS